MNNEQGSWKCGGCGTWYAYWVTKCECEKVVKVSGASTKDWNVLPETDTRIYSSEALKGGVMTNGKNGGGG